MKTVRIGDVQNALVRVILWQAGREPISDRQLRAAKEYFEYKCAYCEEQQELHFDHAVPINKSSLGQHRIGNLIPSCSRCNQEKGQKDFRVFLQNKCDSDRKIARILAYMTSLNYVPLTGDSEIKELIEAARQDIAAVADRCVAAFNTVLGARPTPVAGELPLHREPVRAATTAITNTTRGGGIGHADPDLTRIYEIRRRMNRSFINLRRGCLDQMGVSIAHGTEKVRAVSRSFAKRAHEETELTYAAIIDLLDRHSLG